MLIARAVTVKSRVTPDLKAQLAAETQKSIRDTDRELEKIAKDIERRTGTGAGGISRLDEERRQLLERRESLVAQLKDIGGLQDGQEIARGQVQGFCELRVGDIWPMVLSSEIVIEDGRVVAIREGRNVTVAVPSDGPRPGGQ